MVSHKLVLCIVCIPVLHGFLEPDGSEEVNTNTALMAQVNKLLASQLDLETQLHEALQRVSSLESLIDTQSQKSRDIAFYAYMSKDLVDPATGITVIFDVAKTNEGGGYDPIHGVFQAPINGSYHFQFIGASPENSNPGHIMHVFISKNGMRESYAFLDRNTDHWVQSSAVVVLHLVRGDRVWVEMGEVSGSHMLAGYRTADNATHSHFSGFLIHSD